MDRLAEGPATKAELNAATGLADCWPHLASLIDAKRVVVDGAGYCLPANLKAGRAERHAAVVARIMARLAEGPATKAELNEVTGFVDCWHVLGPMIRAGAVATAQFGRYHLPGTDAPVKVIDALGWRVEELLADLLPHRWAEIVAHVAAPSASVSQALAKAVKAGRIAKLCPGVYALAGAFPGGLPVSTRDPLRLTPGETRCMRYLMQRLIADQVVGIAALESLAAAIVADTGATETEADEIVGAWVKGLIGKGRVEVRETRLMLLRSVGNTLLHLSLGAAEVDDEGEVPA